MTNVLLKYWQVTFLAVVLLIAFAFIGVYGIKLGMDFRGGTMYQIELQKQVSNDEISRISNIISQRVDPSGLKDATVYPVGNQFISVQLSETNPVELEKVEARIRQQGKFESTLNGEIIFTGDEIIKVQRGDTSYGVMRISSSVYEWSLPFVLNEKATKSFKEKTFHQCNVTSYGTNGTPIYDCAKTLFFLDKPNALIVTTEDQYSTDTSLLSEGNRFENIPQGTSIDTLIEDSQLSVMVIDSSGVIDQNMAKTALLKTTSAIVSPDINSSVISDLNAMGFTVKVGEKRESIPWLWSVMNARQVISLTEGITNEDAATLAQAKEYSTLRISGQRSDQKEAKSDLEELAILLESGSLPTPVKTISKETVSPSLGESFLANVVLMGVLAAILVAGVIVVRYKTLKLAIPIVITGISEIIIMMGFLALTQRPLDLAAFAGLIAAIGTGVDSEIVITDEVLGKSKTAHESLAQRAKNALFIIATSAFTIIAVMGPIVFFARNLPGLDKLYGFAVVTIVGALIGILITRPAYNRIIQLIVTSKEAHEHEQPKTN
jgi:preprotein translocase subunit SecD